MFDYMLVWYLYSCVLKGGKFVLSFECFGKRETCCDGDGTGGIIFLLSKY